MGEQWRRLLQQDNELPLCGSWTVNSFAKPASLWCNSSNFPTRRLARGTGGTVQVPQHPRPPVPAPYV